MDEDRRKGVVKMKKAIALAFMAACLYGPLNGTDLNVGISGSNQGISSFSLSIGEYYRVPAHEIMTIERSIPDDEISIVYFLSRRSHKSPHTIVDLRMGGLSWWDITLHLGLDPSTLYVVDSRRYPAPPYGKAYGYPHHHLNDPEIIELVNVRFLSAYHRVSVDDVIDHRSRGQHYRYIDDEYRMKRWNPSPSHPSMNPKNRGGRDHHGKRHGEDRR